MARVNRPLSSSSPRRGPQVTRKQAGAAATATLPLRQPGGLGSGCGQMDPATGSGPPQLAGSGLFQLPAFGLFASVVVAAQGSQVAFAGPAALVVRHRVVEVAPRGPPPAPRCAACRKAGLDQVPKLAAGLVRRFLVPMVAAVAGQRADRHGEAGRTAEIRWTPGYASVPDGLPRHPNHSHAEAGHGVGRGQRSQFPGQRRVDRPEPGDVTGLGRQPNWVASGTVRLTRAARRC